ncbi:helix-turn-helix domain-containing protein [Actinocorallia sp. A-T 12471]|uniref:TetR/AcrR family transcriptional regulator n=1 Tax=Actinocorallia sp. A-T 12471 TaxID=3089813 RepID=UPI0029D0A30C|nr:helix-turn-helix domain-containing protein [Actinocorallia sp. A-T 12471]MDX6741649.1 helix-turn-helix domain-containing protein [Actinocorallia sp. A-T 12471]
MGPKTDRRQQHGEESRQRILDAAVEIAAERGYEGTSMSLVRQRSGMPNSSIYWHFRDKDHLFAAVIDRSYHLWRDRLLDLISARDRSVPRLRQFQDIATAVADSLLERPEFLSLGLMLTLERRPVEAKARERFVEIRTEVHDFARDEFADILHGLPEDRRADLALRLAEFTIATADGVFLAYQLNPDAYDLHGAFATLGTAADALLERWLSES